jgi:hypothetical protein
VLDYGPQAMTLELSTPASLMTGIYDAHLLWGASLTDYPDYPWDTVNFTLLFEHSQPTLIELVPSTASYKGGDIIKVFVLGFPPTVTSANLSIRFGSTQAVISSAPVGDIHGTFVYFSCPAQAPGLNAFSITYVSSDSVDGIFSVGSNLYITSDDFELTCVEGCVNGNNRMSISAALILEQKQSKAILGEPSITFVCRFYSGNTMKNCNVSNVTVGSTKPCSKRTANGCKEILVQYSIHETLKSYLLAPLTSAYLSLVSNDIQLNGLLTPVQFQRAPTVRSAHFSANWAYIIISFDQAISIEMWQECSLLVKRTALGSAPSCIWTDNQNIVITLGVGATVVPGDVLTVSGHLSDVTRTAWNFEQQMTVISAPSQVQMPQISVSGPRAISKCDLALISAVASSSRNTFFWECSNDDSLNAAISNFTDAILSIDGSALTSGKSYYISVKLRTFYGLWSPAVTHVLTSSASPVPTVTMVVPPPPFIRSADIYIEGVATFSRCSGGSTSLQYRWTLSTSGSSASNSTGSFIILQSATPVLFIPAYTLASSTAYTVSLTVGSNGESPATSTQQIRTRREKVVARIAGGNQFVQATSTVSLDGSQSTDPNKCPTSPSGGPCDSTKLLGFLWRCFLMSGQPCRWNNGTVAVFPLTPEVIVDLGQLYTQGLSQIAFQLTVSNADSSDLARCYVGLSTNPVVNVQISTLYITASRVAYLGAAGGSNPSLNWTIIGPSASPRILDTSDAATFITGTSSAYFVFRLDTLAAANMFPPGLTFKVLLNVVSSSAIGMAWLNFTVPFPPMGGVCDATPLQGASLTTKFTAACRDWLGSFPPLSYSFSVRSSSILDPMDSSVTWSPPMSSPSFAVQLPNGNFSLAAMIMDAQGFYAVVPLALIQVLGVGNSPPDVNIAGSLLSAYNLQAQASQVLMLSDSLADSINSQQGTCISGACRRLLGSSAAYRMAVRRLLLRSLTGSVASGVTSRTAPTLLKSAKRISSVPKELDADSLHLAQGQFASFNQLGLRTLQSGAIVDIVKFSRNLILSAVTKMEVDPLDAFNVKIMDSILQLARKCWLGMMPGEQPLTVKLNELALSVVQAHSAEGSELLHFSDDLVNMSSARRASTADALGAGIVRLSSTLVADSTTTKGSLPSAMVGISIWSSSSLTNAGTTWACPDSTSYCVNFEIVFKGELGDYNTSCVRWSGAKWINASCIATAAVAGEGQFFVVNCSCSADGIFKALVIPKKMPIEPMPFISVLAVKGLVFSSWPVVAIAAAVFALSALTIVALYLASWRVDALADPDAHMNDKYWFDLDTPKGTRPDRLHASEQSLRGAYAGGKHTAFKMEVLPTVTADLRFLRKSVHLESVRPPIMFLDD